jgi:hypothetical protein
MTQTATPKFMQRMAFEFNHLTPAGLAVRLQDVPTRNLVVARDAARMYAGSYILTIDAEMIDVAITTEIERRNA